MIASTSRAEVPVRLRDSQFRAAKQRIARRAAELIPAGPYSVAISGGTTTAEVAKVLATRPDLAIVTNALTTAMAIASRPNLKVIMTGVDRTAGELIMASAGDRIAAAGGSATLASFNGQTVVDAAIPCAS